MRARLRLIRHGATSSVPADDIDPGLSILGIRQALGLSAMITEKPDHLLTSPLIRARETAMPLAAAFALERRVSPDYGELPWREGQTVVERANEINQTLGASWSALDPGWRNWRARLIERALSEVGDVIIVSHFVAINVLVGFATRDDRTLIVRPANTSITEFALNARGELSVISLGAQASARLSLHPSPAKGPSS